MAKNNDKKPRFHLFSSKEDREKRKAENKQKMQDILDRIKNAFKPDKTPTPTTDLEDIIDESAFDEDNIDDDNYKFNDVPSDDVYDYEDDEYLEGEEEYEEGEETTTGTTYTPQDEIPEEVVEDDETESTESEPATEETAEETSNTDESKIEKKEDETKKVDDEVNEKPSPEDANDLSKQPDGENKIDNDVPEENVKPEKSDTSGQSDDLTQKPEKDPLSDPSKTKDPLGAPNQKDPLGDLNQKPTDAPDIAKPDKPSTAQPQNAKSSLGSPDAGKSTSNKLLKDNSAKAIDKAKGEVADTAKNVLEKEAKEKIAQEATKKVAKEVTKQGVKKGAEKGAEKGISAILSKLPPQAWIAIAIFAVVVIFIIIVVIYATWKSVMEAQYADTNPEDGQFDSTYGITGDAFYGGRVIYLDQAKSVEELNSYYYSLATDYLNKLDEINGIDLNTSNKNSALNDMTLEIANVVSSEDYNENLNELLATITHFGYTTSELNEIRSELSDYLLDNQADVFVFQTGEDNAYDTTNLENDLETTFADNYSDLNIVAPLYYVKDVILTEDTTITGLQQENYVAFIYMPKANVLMETFEYMFYIPYTPVEDDNYVSDEPAEIESPEDDYLPSPETEMLFKVIKSQNGEETVVITENVDPTWWNNDEQSKSAYASASINTNYSTFLSIDTTNTEYLNGQSLYSLLTYSSDEDNQDNNQDVEDSSQNNQENPDDNQQEPTDEIEVVNIFVDTTIAEIYFKISNAVSEDGNVQDYKEISYLPSQDENYLYLSFNCFSKFQFAERAVEYTIVGN